MFCNTFRRQCFRRELAKILEMFIFIQRYQWQFYIKIHRKQHGIFEGSTEETFLSGWNFIIINVPS